MQPGMIIQARVSYSSGGFGTHTMIVYANAVATSQITVIESNYRGDYRGWDAKNVLRIFFEPYRERNPL